LEFAIDRDRCAQWNINVADVENALQTAVGGKPATQMIEGEKSFDVTLRWPERLRQDEDAILEIPVDVTAHTLSPRASPSLPQPLLSGPSVGVSSIGTGGFLPALTGSALNVPSVSAAVAPRRRLRDLVTPPDGPGTPGAAGQFTRPGASMIYR